MDSVIDACNVPVILHASSKYNSFIQKIKVNQSRFIDKIQKYEERYDHSSYKPVKFLRFIKQVRLPLIQDTPQLTQHCLFSVTQEINMGDLNELLRKIQITEREKRKLQVGNELLLTQMSSPVLQKSLTVTDGGYCRHIVCVAPNRVWISDRNKIILVDTETGVNLCTVEGLCNHYWDSEHAHTASPEGLLVYVDKNYNINTFSVDEERNTIYTNNSGSLWKIKCVYCSPFSGDVLIGLHLSDISDSNWMCENTGKVVRYSSDEQLTQTIHFQDAPIRENRFLDPCYITENNNEDIIVVSNYIPGCPLLVTSREGRYRFSYQGRPSKYGSLFMPSGICTDALSQIIVSDCVTHTVQIISQDGEFLTYLQLPGVDGPLRLCYDIHTHGLWVITRNNDHVVYKFSYIKRNLIGKSHCIVLGCIPIDVLHFYCFLYDN